jgi:alpha-amylase
LEKLLVYDPHTRGSLEERFFEVDAESAPYSGGLLDSREWSFEAELPKDPAGELILRGEGSEIKIEKSLSWTKEGRALDVDYRLEYIGETEKNLLFASGWNFNFLAPEAHDRRFIVDGRDTMDPQLRSEGWESPEHGFEIRDDWSGLSVHIEGKNLRIWREPIETVSMSEAGFERVYQGSWIAVCAPITLTVGKPVRLEYRLRIEKH